MTIKAILFDVLGTVVDMSAADVLDIGSYIEQLRRPTWQPLSLPDEWLDFPAYHDSAAGLGYLRKRYTVVTCSNPPLSFLLKLSKRAGLQWDAIIPLELARVYKTNSQAYLHCASVLGLSPGECLMVTANEKFGDLEAASAVGMHYILIDRRFKYPVNTYPRTITELSEWLEKGKLPG